MITEDYVSFETAKLLKEKGFDADITTYRDDFIQDGNIVIPLQECLSKDRVKTPTLQMAMKWLREVHNILLVIDYEYECDSTPYYFKIYKLGENGKPERVAIKGVSYDKNDNPTEHIVGYRDWERSTSDFPSQEQACEVAIKYCLENLI